MVEKNTIIKKAVTYLNETFDSPEIFVFGSAVSGNFTDESDIDIALYLNGYENYSLKDFVKILFYVQNQISSRLELHFFPAESEPLTFSEHVRNIGQKVA
jgi:predicted nucleotidyltransferase